MQPFQEFIFFLFFCAKDTRAISRASHNVGYFFTVSRYVLTSLMSHLFSLNITSSPARHPSCQRRSKGSLLFFFCVHSLMWMRGHSSSNAARDDNREKPETDRVQVSLETFHIIYLGQDLHRLHTYDRAKKIKSKLLWTVWLCFILY